MHPSASLPTVFFRSIARAALSASLIAAHANIAVAGEIRITPPPAGADRYRASNVRVTVDGKPSFVYALLKQGVSYGNEPSLPSTFTRFDLLHGPTALVATFSHPIRSAVVRPLAAGIAAHVAGNVVRFTIVHPGHYDLEIEGALSHPTAANAPLLVFAETPNGEPSVSGPGVTVFPVGTITDLPNFRLNTVANHTYVIPAGAIVRGVLATIGAANVTIRGHGILLYDPDVWSRWASDRLQQLTPLIAVDAPNFVARDITIVMANHNFDGTVNNGSGHDSSPWALTLIRGTGAHLDNLKIFNELLDGIELNGTSGTVVSNSFVQAHDDTLGIKASCYGFMGGGAGFDPHDILFENDETITTGPGHPMQITELNVPGTGHAPQPCSPASKRTTAAYGITYRNIDVLHSGLDTLQSANGQLGVMSIQDPYPADVHDVRYEGITIEDERKEYLADFDLHGGPEFYSQVPGSGRIRGITLAGVKAAYVPRFGKKGALVMMVSGLSPAATVSGVTIAGLAVNGVPVRGPGPGLFLVKNTFAAAPHFAP